MGNSQSNDAAQSKARERSGSIAEQATNPSAIKKRTSIRRTGANILSPSTPPRERKGSDDTASIADRLSLLDEQGSSAPQSISRRNSIVSSSLPEDSLGAQDDVEDTLDKVSVVIKWSGSGNKVFITGSFTHWRKKIYLTKADGEKEFSTTLNLVPGTHRLKFNVDGEWRTNEHMAVATDSSGNFVNYIEASLSGDDLSLKRETPVAAADFPSKVPEEVWTNTIPSFMTPSEELLNSTAMIPPSLPPHLEKVILNTSNERKDDHSVLPHPNHVVLNHLAASSIRNGVLAVSASTRYRRKYVTTILYKPAN